MTLPRILALVLTVLLLAAPVARAEKKPPSDEDWKKAMTPGTKHEWLKEFVGTWQASSRFWMEPGKPPMKSKGVSVQKMVLGGRYLQQQYKGEMPPMGTFYGLGYTGYDNTSKYFVGTWMDSFGTGIIHMTGVPGDDPRTMTMTASFLAPGKQKPTQVRSVTKVIDPKKHVFEWFERDSSKAKWHRTMEIVYTRK